MSKKAIKDYRLYEMDSGANLEGFPWTQDGTKIFF